MLDIALLKFYSVHYNGNENHYQLFFAKRHMKPFIAKRHIKQFIDEKVDAITYLEGYMMSRIHAEELHKHYGHNKIIKGIDLDIPDKKVTAIIGSNGCGKSTLLKAMTRIIPYQQGAVIFDGKMIS